MCCFIVHIITLLSLIHGFVNFFFDFFVARFRAFTAPLGSVLGNAHFYVAYCPLMHKLSAWLDRYALNMLGLRIM